jgi:hypothetical protein
MSLISSQITRGGIVMAADRCASAMAANAVDMPERVALSHNAEKIHVTTNNIGISSMGIGLINKVPLEHVMYDFINTLDVKTYKTPSDVSHQLKAFLRHLSPAGLDATFHIGGYDKDGKPALYLLQAQYWTVNHENTASTYSWAEFAAPDPFTELIFKRVGNAYGKFNLRMAIDFAKFVNVTTADIMAFSGAGEAVSRKSDILVIYQDRHEWIKG